VKRFIMMNRVVLTGGYMSHWKLLLSVTMSSLIVFFAWIVVQLSRPLGHLLFVLAFVLPLLLFGSYYRREPRALVPFFLVTLLAVVVMVPPPIMGLNLTSALHLKTGCWGVEGGTWPLNGSADVIMSCRYLMEPAGEMVYVAGLAWRDTEVELPLRGRFVVLWEPREKADEAYLNALHETERKGYVKVSENFGGGGILRNVLMRKGSQCVYIGEMRIAKGLAVVSARGQCEGVEEFVSFRASRW
jgi:hypothetical protein